MFGCVARCNGCSWQAQDLSIGQDKVEEIFKTIPATQDDKSEEKKNTTTCYFVFGISISGRQCNFHRRPNT